jgi:ribonuclease HII
MNKDEKHYIKIIEKIIGDFADSYSESDTQINIQDKNKKIILCYVKNHNELYIDTSIIDTFRDILPRDGMYYVKPAAKKYFNSQIEGDHQIRTVSVAGIV